MRPTIDEYFMLIAETVSKRSTCIRIDVGSVIVKDNFIISSGYNGAPSGLPHCLDIGCASDSTEIPDDIYNICRATHAEQNAIIQAVHGNGTKDSTLYCTHQPCRLCAKMIINAKISKVVYKHTYPDLLGVDMLHMANIKVIKL